MRALIFTTLLFINQALFSQAVNLSVAPSSTDVSILDEGKMHEVWLNMNISSNGLLFIMLPGTSADPNMYDEITSTAANLGYYAFSLAYPNGQSISNLCADALVDDCSENARLEIIDGIDYHDELEVDAAIIFSDILVIPEAMGLPYELIEKVFIIILK